MSSENVILQRYTRRTVESKQTGTTMSYRRLTSSHQSMEADSSTVSGGTLMSDLDSDHLSAPTVLPWGAPRERAYNDAIHISANVKPGEFVLQTLFADFCVMAEKKICAVLEAPSRDKPLSKLLTRGEDANFDQLLTSLGSVAENCLPSLLRVLFEWYDRQNSTDVHHRQSFRNFSDKEHLLERRDLAVDFVYCLVLIEILRQLFYHPGHDELINHIINEAFRHFRYKEGTQSSPNATNINVISDLYAEVIAEVAKSRFVLVRKKFITELKELRQKDQNPFTIHSIINLLMGMKFFRVKMHSMEEFQSSMSLLQEMGQYFLEVKDKQIKHSLAGLFVEILLPVAAVVKNEVNVPILKNFVETMYTPTYDLMAKKKHTLPLFPMITCLLCVGQKQFFLNNWPHFLQQCLARLKDRDQKMARVALEALYRLLWVYVIRIKCESNTNTSSRLQSIVTSLFPRGSKLVYPRDAPISIFVKIIQFISQERLDFAMREIIYDLLCVGKQSKAFYSPERMSIGLRAFLVIADGLQQKEGEPPMPQTVGVLPSGNTLRFKKTFLNKYLSEDMARSIGMATYYSNVRKAFDAILKYLDQQVGRPLMMTRSENLNKETVDIITGERKQKIDLFRTCVAAVPRLLPDGMTRQDLIDLFSRLTVHMDGELGKLAFQSLQNVVVDLPDWRNDVLLGFVQFIHREVSDSFPSLLEQCNRRLIMLLNQWKSVALSSQNNVRSPRSRSAQASDSSSDQSDTHSVVSTQGIHLYSHEQIGNRNTLHTLEGFALIMLCSSKPIIKKLAVVLLKEVRNLFGVLNLPKDSGDPCVLDMMDKACPHMLEKVLPHLPGPEKAAALSASVVDFQWLADRTSVLWTSGSSYHTLSDAGDGTTTLTSEPMTFDPWMESMSIFLHPDYVMGHCTTAVSHAWPILFSRLQASYVHVDPLTTAGERTGSILRGSKKVTTERDMYMNLWKNYVTMGCCIAPPSQVMFEQRSISPELNTSSPETPERMDLLHPPSPGMTARELFKNIIPQIRCDFSDMRETVVSSLGHINPAVFSDLVEEIFPLIKEAIERKAEGVRRKKRRDVLRLALARIFRAQAEAGIFVQSPADVIDPVSDALCQTFVEYIDGATMFLDCEGDKDSPHLADIKLHFSEFIRHLIKITPVSKRSKLLSQSLRSKLSGLFSSWAGPFCLRPPSHRTPPVSSLTTLELSSLKSMSSVLCCGPIYDPALLNDDGALYCWLEVLLGNHDNQIKPQIYELAQEVIVLLLEFNGDSQGILDWVIDRCYTGQPEVANGCFNALGIVFNNREYPCDLHAMLNVVLLNTGNPCGSVQQTAIQLLHILYRRFFLDDILVVMDTDTAGWGGGAPLGDPDKEGVFLRHTPRVNKRELEETLLSGPYNRSQLALSEAIAQLHVELTMPMISEITHRFQTAIPPVRQMLLQYLLPWLHNMELADPNLTQIQVIGNMMTMKDGTVDSYPKPPLKGEGWGSAQGTEMVLNNLFYITAKFGNDHPKEIEDLWSALVSCWPGNLPVIIRYIVVLLGIAPSLLCHAKRVVVYLSRTRTDRVVDEIINELRTIEPLNFNVERTETPPFYRLTSLKKQQASASSDGNQGEQQEAPVTLNKGQIHTKRHSAEDPGKLSAAEGSPLRTASTSSLRSEASTGSSVAASKIASEALSGLVGDEEPGTSKVNTADLRRCDSPLPFPLPMPAFGGYYAPMSDMLPEEQMPNPPYQRCNLAVMLLSDLVMDSVEVDWSVHLPYMLHIIFLGLDHSRQLIHEHCKALLLNLLLVLSAHNDHLNLGKIIISNKSIAEETALTLPNTTGKDYAYLEGSCDSAVSTVVHTPTSTSTMTTDSVDTLPDVSTYTTTGDVCKALAEFLVTKKSKPLWSYEDITSKVHRLRSAEQLERFLDYVLRVFQESLPLAHIEQRWAQEALHLALSCPSRHYAGRSFQIFRALHVPLTSSDLSEILSRLVETVAEQGEDMQGYVTEIMLTLEASVDNVDVEMKPLTKDIFLSTPNLSREARVEMRRSVTSVPLRQQGAPTSPHSHMRSTSYNLSIYARRAVISSPPIMENKPADTRHIRHSSGDSDPPVTGTRRSTNLSRSRSAVSLKYIQDSLGHDDKLTILSQMFWIAVSMMESDYEYEFLLTVKLLVKILEQLQPDRPECREKLDKILQQICWSSYPGLQALLLKGLTAPGCAESTWLLMSKLCRCVTAPVIDPSQCEGLPMNVIALLPYLVEYYDEPTQLCIEAADAIAQMCQEHTSKLANLTTVMTLYSHGTFTKNSFQWTKCVVKYLYDVYYSMNDSLIAMLLEMLEKGPPSYQASILKILNCIVNYMDLSMSSSQSITSDMFRVVAKYIQNSNWRDALLILKLCVSRSSSLTAAPPNANVNMSSILDASAINVTSHMSFAEAEVSFKKELPGRTMDFQFDQGQVNIIGHKLFNLPSPDGDTGSREGTVDRRSGAEGASLSPGASVSESLLSGWKKPQLSQGRTRARFINLLNCYGPRIMMPKSPSVIFSHDSPSDTLERQPSTTCSSSEEASLADGMTGEIKIGDDSSGEQPLQILDSAFDFLDDQDSSCDFFGVKRHSMNLDEEEDITTKEDRRDESSDEETQSASPMEEYQPDLAAMPTIAYTNPTSLEMAKQQSMSGSMHSIHSSISEVDLTPDPAEYSPSHSASPRYVALSPVLRSSEDLAELWKVHTDKVIKDPGGTQAVNTFFLFARLFQDVKAKLREQTADALMSLQQPDLVANLAANIASIMDLMMQEIECPLVFIDISTLASCRLLERHKFSLLEIHESFETYVMRRQQTLEVMDTVQVLESGDELPEEHKLQLCKCLYRQYFQLLQLFEGYNKLVSNLARASQSVEVTDLTRDVLELKEDLTKAWRDLDSPSSVPFTVDIHTTTQRDAERLVMDLLLGKNYSMALHHVHNLRKVFPVDIVDFHLSDDIEALLYIYCQHQTAQKPGILAICQPDHDLSEVYSRLMELKVQLSSAIHLLEAEARAGEDEQVTVKMSDSSSL